MSKLQTPYRKGPLYLVSRDGMFQIHGTFDGKRIRVSTKTDQLRDAKTALDDLHGELHSGWRETQSNQSWKSVARSICTRHRSSAKERGIPFQISPSEVYRLMKATDFRCAVSGISFSRKGSAGAPDPWAPSIDRIEGRQGYINGNVRVVCLAANLAMNRWGFDVLLRLSMAVANNANHVIPEKLTHHLNNGSAKVDLGNENNALQ